MLQAKLISILLVFLILAGLSCDRPAEPEDCADYDYSDCNTTEPQSGKITLLVTVNKKITSVPVSVYKGQVDEGKLLLKDTLDAELKKYDMPVDEYYSVIAYYDINGRKIKAVSGGKLKLNVYPVCDSICYVLKEPVINVRLKKEVYQ